MILSHNVLRITEMTQSKSDYILLLLTWYTVMCTGGQAKRSNYSIWFYLTDMRFDELRKWIISFFNFLSCFFFFSYQLFQFIHFTQALITWASTKSCFQILFITIQTTAQPPAPTPRRQLRFFWETVESRNHLNRICLTTLNRTEELKRKQDLKACYSSCVSIINVLQT